MAGYSAIPLQKKLGIKENNSLFIVNAPDAYFDWVSPLPQTAVIKSRIAAEMDFIHLFVFEKKVFESDFLKYKRYIKRTV